MALNRLGRGQIGNAFSRIAGLDDLNGIPDIAPEVMPTISLFDRPEFWMLQGGKLGTCVFNFAAGGAGTTGFGVLHNASDSGALAIIDKIIIRTATAIEWASVPDNAVTAAVNVFHRDSRWSPGNLALGLSLKGDGGTTGGGGLNPHGSATGPIVVEGAWILIPSYRFVLTPPQNTAWYVTVEWRERPMTPTETSP